MTTVASELTGYLYASLTLSERVSSQRRRNASWVRQEIDASRAADALRRWKSQHPFTVGDYFEQRLHAENLTEEDLLAILALPAEAYSEFFPTPPQWAQDVHRLYSAECSAEEVNPQFLRWSKDGANGFLWIVEPLIQDGLRRFREALPTIPAAGAPFEPAVIEHLVLPNLFSALKPLVEKAMVLELNIARVRGQLHDERPEERFRSFCESLRDPEVRLSMARAYPALFRSLYVRTINWVDYTVELLDRLCQDWDLIQNDLLRETEPTTLTAISTGAGDDHRRGRTVAILEFSSGLKLVYKPRSMSLDKHFAEFLEWVNQSGFEPRFRSPKVIVRDGYGWSEFIAHKPCSSHGEVERFYERLGGYLAIFHAFRANDMHFDNLIAAGEFPIPVDIETLFHAVVKQEEDPAFNAWQSSVMRVLLLPTRILGSETQAGVDISGLGGKSGQYYPAGSVETWEGTGTDEMRLVRDKAVLMTPGENRPKLNTEEVSLDEFVDSFVGGFTRVYRLLKSRRTELEAPGGILDRFAEDEVRFVARPTMTYGTLLEKAFHPDMLRNAVARDQLFDYLWIGATGRPHLAQLIPAELQDLHSGDIPAFTARPSSRDLWTSSGERIAGFFEQPAMEAVRHGLRRMGDEDMALQTWYIRAAIASDVDSMQVASPGLLLAGSRDCMDLARAVGDALCKQALEHGSYASWVGLIPMGARETSWSLEPLDFGLYSGISGCSFFLAYLGALTGDDAYRKISRKSIDLVRRQLERLKLAGLSMPGLGGFSGLGGIIYTLAHLGFL
jgi:type 2 lantibiotic biosynthesis protein LanM